MSPRRAMTEALMLPRTICDVSLKRADLATHRETWRVTYKICRGGHTLVELRGDTVLSDSLRVLLA